MGNFSYLRSALVVQRHARALRASSMSLKTLEFAISCKRGCQYNARRSRQPSTCRGSFNFTKLPRNTYRYGQHASNCPQLRLAAKLKALCPAGTARLPAWWSDTNVNAYGAYRIIQNRFKRHGSQSEFVCVRLQHSLILPGVLQHGDRGWCRRRKLQATDK